jgi:hypothetical protein
MKILIKKIVKKTARSMLDQYCRCRLRLRKKPFKIILILAHARSGSTLIQHLLLTNPQITGYGENHKTYHELEDFGNLACNTLWRLRKFKMPETYLVDKIVHHRSFWVSDRVIQSEKVFTIFFVRNPYDSILSLSENRHDELPNSSQYYIEMLDKLEQYGRLVADKDHGFFLTYDQLINRTDSALSRLEEFLKLDIPLDEKYDLLPTTGKGTYGDWSENIKSGKIVRIPKKQSLEIPPELISPVKAAYRHCCEALSKCCSTID